MANYVQQYNGEQESSGDVIEELIMKTYFALFEENKIEKKLDNRIPSIKQIFTKADYDFDTSCYDVIYQIDKSSLTEENIMLLLERKGCIYRWGAFICGDGQLTMFDDDELMGDGEGWYIDAPNK